MTVEKYPETVLNVYLKKRFCISCSVINFTSKSRIGKLNEKTGCVQTTNSDIPKSHQSFLPLWPISNRVGSCVSEESTDGALMVLKISDKRSAFLELG